MLALVIEFSRSEPRLPARSRARTLRTEQCAWRESLAAPLAFHSPGCPEAY